MPNKVQVKERRNLAWILKLLSERGPLSPLCTHRADRHRLHVGSISDVEPQAKSLASVVGGIAVGLVAASGSGYFFTPVPTAGVKGGWMFATAFIVWVLYRIHTKYEAALLEKVNLKLLLASAAADGFYGAYGAASFCLGVVFLMSGIGLSARQPKRVDPNIYLIAGSMVVTLAGLAAPLFF